MKIFKIFIIFISVLILLILVVFFCLVGAESGKGILGYKLRWTIGEGEEFTPIFFLQDFSFAYKFVCKPGLKAIFAAKESSDGGCAFPMCSCYVCTKCGDGKCGTGENKCNCSEDCSK